MGQDAFNRALVYARERGGRWDEIAEALDITPEQVRDRYAAVVNRWGDAVNRRGMVRSVLASRMPDGTTEPDQTAADLDQWRLRHIEENSGARHNARNDGVDDRMVSANLPAHTAVTEINSFT